MQSIPAFMKIDQTTCIIKRLTLDVNHRTNDSPPGTFETIASGVVCALDRSISVNRSYSGGREISFQGATDQTVFKLFLLSTEDILLGDRVVVGGVEHKVDDVISFSTHKEAILTK